MKTKITAILTFLAASVFAFAETATEVTTTPETTPAPQAAPAKPVFTPKARPQVSPEMREAFVQRILLSLSEEDLAKLAEKVATAQKMTAEEKAEAVKALPKPEFRPMPKMKKFRGHPLAKPGKMGPKFKGPKCKGPKCKGPKFRGPKCGKKMGKWEGRRGHGPKFCGRRGPAPKACGFKKPCCCPKMGAPLPPPPAAPAPKAPAEAPVAE